MLDDVRCVLLRFARADTQVVDDLGVAECRDGQPKTLSMSICLEHFLKRTRLGETGMWYCSSCKVRYNMSTVVLSYSLALFVEDISCSHARKNRMKMPPFDTFGTPLQ